MERYFAIQTYMQVYVEQTQQIGMGIVKAIGKMPTSGYAIFFTSRKSCHTFAPRNKH